MLHSADDLPGEEAAGAPGPPERRGRKPGKQPGAAGAYLTWSGHPDKTVDVFPGGACKCDLGLSGAPDPGVAYSHQVIDLPEAPAETTQYDRREVECLCGRRHPCGTNRQPDLLSGK
jgi:hypothetical protein